MSGSKCAPRSFSKGGKKAFADGGLADGGLPPIGRTPAAPMGQAGMATENAGPPTGASMGGYDPMNPMQITGFKGTPVAPMGQAGMGVGNAGMPAPGAMPEAMPLANAAGQAAAQRDIAQAAPAYGQLRGAMQDASGGMGGGGRAMRRPGGSGMGGGMGAGARFDQAQRGGGAQMKPLMGYADGGKVKKQNTGKGGKFVPFAKGAPKASKGTGPTPKGFEKPTEKGNVIRAFADGGCVTNKRDMKKG